MMHPATRLVSMACLIGFSVIAMVLNLAIPAMAGVGLPPMPDANDTNALEQYRIKVFYEAQKSQQEKLKVGQERYDRMLTNRAHTITAMAAELAERQKEVGIQSGATAERNVENDEPNTWMGTTLGAAVIGLGFLGFRYYLNRQNLKDMASQKY
jgi:hypothetical protein